MLIFIQFIGLLGKASYFIDVIRVFKLYGCAREMFKFKLREYWIRSGTAPQINNKLIINFV